MWRLNAACTRLSRSVMQMLLVSSVFENFKVHKLNRWLFELDVASFNFLAACAPLSISSNNTNKRIHSHKSAIDSPPCILIYKSLISPYREFVDWACTNSLYFRSFYSKVIFIFIVTYIDARVNTGTWCHSLFYHNYCERPVARSLLITLYGYGNALIVYKNWFWLKTSRSPESSRS